MRCAICLEEMDHPMTSVFSCPRKKEKWHTRDYRNLKRKLDELEYSSFGATPEGQAERAKLEILVLEMKA